MKLTTTLIAALLLAGCNATMSNRVACTVGKDKSFLVSEYGPVGISAVIDDKDAAVICK
jgi:outer membrane biogenesis lipoprotein LolB